MSAKDLGPTVFPQAIQGPDEIALVLEPYDDGFVWKLQNDRGESVFRIRMQAMGVQSFYAAKETFRPLETIRMGSSVTPELKSSHTTEKAQMLFWTDGTKLSLAYPANELPWPPADHSTDRRWLVRLKVSWQTGEWFITLDVRWTVGTKTIRIEEYIDTPAVPKPVEREAPSSFTASPSEQSHAAPAIDRVDRPAEPESAKRPADWDVEFNVTTRPLLWERFRYDRSSKDSKFLLLLPHNHVNFSIPAPNTNRGVVTKIATEAGIPIEFLSADLDKPVFTRGRAIFGYLGDQIDDVARNYPNMRWWISDCGLSMAILSADEILVSQRTPVTDGPNLPAPAAAPLDMKPNLAALMKAQPHLNQRLRKKYEAVVRYGCYLKELQTLKVATKKYQTPALLKQQFPELEVWAVLDKDDEQDIAAGVFDPGRFAWVLVQRMNNRKGKDDRTLQNYRKALRAAGISF